jgi:hypothetical protein
MSWNKVYCLFSAAMYRLESYLVTPMDPRHHVRFPGLKSHIGRFTLHSASFIALLESGSNARLELDSNRQFGDKHSLIIELNTLGLVQPGSSIDLLDLAGFKISAATSNSVVPYLKIESQILKSAVLLEEYLSAPQDALTQPHLRKRFSDLMTALKDTTLLQLTMLDADQRPPEYADIVRSTHTANSAMGKFTIPKWWSYHDKSVQRFLLGMRKVIEEE